MLTPQEEAFIRYWEENRSRQKKIFRQFLVGIPVGLAFVVPILINIISGWDNKVDRLYDDPNNSTGSPYGDKSLLMVLMVAMLLIIGFTAIFYRRYKWDQYEQRYRELLARRERLASSSAEMSSSAEVADNHSSTVAGPPSPAPDPHSPGN